MKLPKKKLSLFDKVILVVIALAIVLVAYKALSVNKTGGTGSHNDYVDTTFTVFIENVRMATVEALNVGDKIYESKTGTCFGTITELNYQNHMEAEINANNEAVWVVLPGYYDVEMTIESRTLEKETGYFVEGVVELKRNSKYYSHTKFACPEFQVMEIYFGEDIPENNPAQTESTGAPEGIQIPEEQGDAPAEG